MFHNFIHYSLLGTPGTFAGNFWKTLDNFTRVKNSTLSQIYVLQNDNLLYIYLFFRNLTFSKKIDTKAMDIVDYPKTFIF